MDLLLVWPRTPIGISSEAIPITDIGIGYRAISVPVNLILIIQPSIGMVLIIKIIILNAGGIINLIGMPSQNSTDITFLIPSI